MSVGVGVYVGVGVIVKVNVGVAVYVGVGVDVDVYVGVSSMSSTMAQSFASVLSSAQLSIPTMVNVGVGDGIPQGSAPVLGSTTPGDVSSVTSPPL